MLLENFHIGTSGWSYTHWSGLFYPEGLKPARYLEHYATVFSCVELNASFYRIPRIQTVEGWAQRTPQSFRFCAKMNRFITHRKKLVDVAEPLDRFLDVFEPLRERLGPFLVQLPPSLRFDPDIAESFLQLIDTYRDRHAFALEARHPSWFIPEALNLLRTYSMSLVIANSGGRFPETDTLTGFTIYIRFHGPFGNYSSPYTPDVLHGYARKIAGWLGERRTVWAFFNNDIDGHAVYNACELEKLVASPCT